MIGLVTGTGAEAAVVKKKKFFSTFCVGKKQVDL